MVSFQSPGGEKGEANDSKNMARLDQRSQHYEIRERITYFFNREGIYNAVLSAKAREGKCER
jgi:hypothetical protein